MAKVTATDANGNDVPVIQVQFNNLGEVESFLTLLESGQHKWVFAKDYSIEVDDASEQPDITPGVLTKKQVLTPNETVRKVGLVDNTDPEPTEPAAVVDDTPLDDGIISEGDLNGPKPTAPILGEEAGPEQPPVEPPVTEPNEPETPPTEPPVEPPTVPVVPEPTSPTPKPSKPAKPTKPAAKK